MKRSITIAGHRTSVFVDDGFWQALGEIAAARGGSVAAVVAEIDKSRGAASLSAKTSRTRATPTGLTTAKSPSGSRRPNTRLASVTVGRVPPRP